MSLINVATVRRWRRKHLQEQFQQREGDASQSCWLHTHTNTGSSCSLCSCTTKSDIVSTDFYEVIRTNDWRARTTLLWKKDPGELWVFSLKMRRVQGDLTESFQYLKEPTRKLERDLWSEHDQSRECSDKIGQVYLRYKEELGFFRIKLPREGVGALSLKVFRSGWMGLLATLSCERCRGRQCWI